MFNMGRPIIEDNPDLNLNPSYLDEVDGQI